MKIIITMAGQSRRFKTVGIEIPKYKIKANGRTLFEWSLLSLENLFDNDFIFIVRQKDQVNDFIKTKCDELGISKFCIESIEMSTAGQAMSALCAPNIVQDESILIYNIDTFISNRHIDESLFKECDGCIPVFRTDGTHWSFVKPDKQINGKAVQVTERKPISNLASIGMYYFQNWTVYQTLCLKYKDEILKEYGEVYIAPLYQKMINEDRFVKYVEIPSSSVHILGTPTELSVFRKYDEEKLIQNVL